MEIAAKGNSMTKAETAVREKLGWGIVNWNGVIALQILGLSEEQGIWGATDREKQAFAELVSQEAEIQKLREALEATDKALEFAIEHLWSGVNGLMQMRDSSSLTPTQEAWCRSAKGVLLSRAALTPPQ